ncbi:MAG: hypothetical protein UZ21_OP11001001023 [Microgenomates bacterium OLB22]|nr:MAG: hypothetical protein UZ21_OP11001001023 [Microgenomates bacterium OLB22]
MRAIAEVITGFPGHVVLNLPYGDKLRAHVNIGHRCTWMLQDNTYITPREDSMVIVLHPEDMQSPLVIRNDQGTLEITTYGRWQEQDKNFAKYMTSG